LNDISRRAWLGEIAALTGVTGLLRAQHEVQTEARRGTTPLLDDLRFQRGLRVWQPAPGKKIESGTIKPAAGVGELVWGLSQWYSHFNLAGARLELLASGSSFFSDPGMAVTFGVTGSPECDLILSLNGRAEYGDRAPAPGEAWPHLLVEQSLRRHPYLKDLRALPFQISYRLLKSQAFHFPGWDPRRHTAQLQFYVTVENGNGLSSGFGDYLWFDVPMYDARYRLSPPHEEVDFSTPQKKGTGKFIFNPGGTRYTTHSANDGKWVTIDKDLLPLINEGLTTAWHAGFLQGSHDPADYRLGEVNLGWEVTGPLNVAMQIRGLRFDAVMESGT